MRQGFQPLSDYRFDLIVDTPWALGVSLRLIMVGKRHCRLLYIIPATQQLLGFIQSEKLL